MQGDEPDIGFEEASREKLLDLQREILKQERLGTDTAREKSEGLQIELEIVEALLAAERQFGLENRRLVGQLSRDTGLNLDKIPATFQEGALGVSKINDQLKIAGVLIPKIAGEFTTGSLTEEQKKAVEANTIFNAVLKDTNEGFNAGALNSDKLSAKIAGLSSQFVTLKEAETLSAEELKKFR